MARIARSDAPLYQTRGRPVSWPVAMTEPDGSATDLTGKTVTAELRWAAVQQTLTVDIPTPADGAFVVRGTSSLTADLPLGRIAELVVSITDSQGDGPDYVWPVIGEVP